MGDQRTRGDRALPFGFMGGYNGLEVEGRPTAEGIGCDLTADPDPCLREDVYALRQKVVTKNV